MNLSNLENDFGRTGDLVREAFRGDRINAALRQAYWRTQLVMCSVLLKASPFEHLKPLVIKVHSTLLEPEEIRAETSKTFSSENIDVDSLPEDARLTFSEALLTGSMRRDYLLIMTMQTLTHAQRTTRDMEEFKNVCIAIGCIQPHYDNMRRRQEGQRLPEEKVV